MSRQFQVYLLPADVESLIRRLSSELNVVLIQPYSAGLYPVKAESPFRQAPLEPENGSSFVNCYLARSMEAEIKMHFIAIRDQWSVVEDGSEVIEFHGCEYDGSLLVRGRFYFHTDFLANGIIAPKRAEFLVWADKVFRRAKRSLRWSKPLGAYVGEEADKWKQGGGRFAWMVTSARGPLYAAED